MPPKRDILVKAVSELREKTPKRKFTQSIELHLNLKEIDLRKPEQRINVSIEMPHKVNKEIKVCAIATGDLASKAKRSNINHIIERDDLEKLSGDKKEAKRTASEYHHFIAEASLMPKVGKILGPYLGPRGRMPTPIPPNAPLEEIVEKHVRTVRARVRDQPSLKCRVATEDMSDAEIVENLQAMISGVEARLPKGERNIKSIMLKATMGPPVKIL